MQSKVVGKINPVLLLSVAIVVLVGVVAVWVGRDEPEPEPEVVQEPEPEVQRIELSPLPETPEEVASEFELEGDLPPLNQSDEALRSHLQLLGGMAPLDWLADEQLIRRIVVQVANIPEGDLIYQQTPLVRQGTIQVRGLGDNLYLLDRDSYHRYDAYVDLLDGIEPDLLVAFYRYYEPLLDQAYAELGNPIGAFRGELLTAIEMVLTAPVIEGDIELLQIGTTYEFRDPALEALPAIHKQLIRMGPENTQRLQLLLRRFRDRVN